MGAEMSERGIPAEVLARENAELRVRFEELRQELRSACDARDVELNRAVEQEERAEQAEAEAAALRARVQELEIAMSGASTLAADLSRKIDAARGAK